MKMITETKEKKEKRDPYKQCILHEAQIYYCNGKEEERRG
jgi:hypothetical protein